MATFILQPGQDILNGTGDDDQFFGSNNNLSAGDRLIGNAGNDTFFYAADATLGGGNPRTFAAFVLDGVETFDVTNDSGAQLIFDLSSSTGLQMLSVSNSSAAVTFDQVTSLTDVTLSRTTSVVNTNVAVRYQDAVLAGASTIQVNLDQTNANILTLGSVSTPNAGIETVNLVLNGSSIVNQLNTNLTSLNISGTGDVVINAALNNTVRNIGSSVTGDLTLSWAANAVGVTFTGSAAAGSDNFLNAGAGNDIVNTFGGNDIVFANAGDDQINAGDGNNQVFTGSGTNVVNTGSGSDLIVAQGTLDTINSGDGADQIDIRANVRALVNAGDGNDTIFGNGAFDASAGNDSINGGTGTDTLTVNAGLVDGNFVNASNIERLQIDTGGLTVLSGSAQASGIDTIVLNSGIASDTVNAGAFTRGLNVISFGSGDDVVNTGTGSDLIDVVGDGNLTSTDSLQSDGGMDTLRVFGDATLTGAGANGFGGIETVLLVSSRGVVGATGNQANLTLSNANAPSMGGVLAVNASQLAADTDGGGVLAAETLVLDGSAVTAYRLDITGGAADDNIRLGGLNDIVAGGAGNDTIDDTGVGDDLIDGGLGNDAVFLRTGNNTLYDGAGDNFTLLGTGNDSVFYGIGNDTVFAFIALNSADRLDGGAGNNTLQIADKNYVDADFTNVTNFQNLLITDAGFTTTLGAEAQQAGITTVTASNAGASTINAGAFTRGLTVDVSAGGNDVVTTGSGDDLVIAGPGTGIGAAPGQTFNLGAGNDRVRVDGLELEASDVINGGTGTDTIELDNTNGGVNAVVNLSNVASIERYEFRANGDRLPGVDADANALTFSGGNVATVTAIAVDASRLSDPSDFLTVVLAADLNDADYAFNITGSSTETIVVKNNVGINNNINFQGGSGVDTFVISGGDLGATTIFNGNGGNDVIRQTAGLALTDDSFVGVSNVEVLTADVGQLNATFGDEADRAGFSTVIGTTGNDNLLLAAEFNNALRIALGNGGDDTINASASAAALTIDARDGEVTAADTLLGGTTANDRINLTATNGTADLTSMVGVEYVAIIADANPLAATGTTVTVDTLLAEVTGGIQTFDAQNFDALDSLTVNAAAATANIAVFGGAGADTVTLGVGSDFVIGGAGNDIINVGAGFNTVLGGLGDDRITSLGGVDTLEGGAGNDRISAGAGNDIIRGDGGDDAIRGEAGNDTITGGAGADQIRGGLGLDVMDGGAGADIFFYGALAESSSTAGRDTINNFESGVDRIDARGVTGAVGPGGINFAGNFGTFGDSQGAITAGDGVLDVVYQQDNSILWFDLNDDGALNADDLQIRVNLASGNTLQAADVFGGMMLDAVPLANFEALFV